MNERRTQPTRTSSAAPASGSADPVLCVHCHKRPAVCVCSFTPTLKTKTRVLILQHPQEPDKELGSAIIAHRALPNSVLRTGLSWRNLSAALGEPAEARSWGVLFLGTKEKSNITGAAEQEVLIDGQDAMSNSLHGIVVLDGNWRQAKALWWRNAWLLKLHRIVLNPHAPSLYGGLRKEPRRESLSTLESIALVLGTLEPDLSAKEALIDTFRKFLNRAQHHIKAPKAPRGARRARRRS